MPMVHIIKQKVINQNKTMSSSLHKLLKSLDKSCDYSTQSFEDYKFTVFYRGRSSTFFARQFNDPTLPSVFTERRFQATSEIVQLEDPQEINIRDMLITETGDYKQISHKIEKLCLNLMERDLSESGRYNDLMEIGGIPRTEALRYCMFEKLYPDIEFFKMSAQNIKIAIIMIDKRELSINLYSKDSLSNAVQIIKKRSKTPKTEMEILYSKFGKRLADYIIMQRKKQIQKFYQLPFDTLEKFVYCEDKEYERYRFIFSAQDICEFDRLIELADGPNILVVVFKNSNGIERAVIVNTHTKKKVPFKI